MAGKVQPRESKYTTESFVIGYIFLLFVTCKSSTNVASIIL